MIERYGGVVVTEKGAEVDGRFVSWEDVERLLGALVQIAHDTMKWFPLMGPPSRCLEGREEMLRIVQALVERDREKKERSI